MSAELEWTSEDPTVSGFYWLAVPAGSLTTVKVNVDKKWGVAVIYPGVEEWDYPHEVAAGRLWCGPLTHPPLPKENER